MHLNPKRITDLSNRGFSLTKMHLFKVKEWFGFTCFFLVFEKIGNSLLGIEPKQYWFIYIPEGPVGKLMKHEGMSYTTTVKPKPHANQ